MQSITSAHDDGVIVRAIISMGNSLKLKVVAECVETANQLDFLKTRHCEEGQGYFFSAPLTLEMFYNIAC